MKNEEILKKAIEKALDNGMKSSEKFLLFNFVSHPWELIFNHDFARAFWGEEPVCRDCKGSTDQENKPAGNKYCETGWHEAYSLLPWQYHLQQMVLYEDPLRYLESYL